MRRQASAGAGDHGITEGVIWKQLLAFFFPILLGTFFQQLYNTADAIIVGKFAGKVALAAVGGPTGVLIGLIVGFFVGLSSGATVIVSQFFGARKAQDVKRTVDTGMAMAVVGGLFVTLAGLFLSPVLLRWMGTPEEVMDLALTYIRVYFIGTIPSLVYNIGSGLLRAMGDSRRPLYFLIVACLTNIVLDIVLVVGLEMGVAGAAIATILSQAVSAALVLLSLCRTHEAYRLRLREIRFHGDLLRRIVAIGMPAGLQSVMYSVSNMIIQAGVNGFGTDTLAAWTAYGKLDGLYWMTIGAFGVAITTFVGQNFGAGLYDRMRKSVRVCFGMSAAVTIFISAVMLLFGRTFLGLFTDDAEVVRLGESIVRLLVPTYVTYVAVEILAGAVRGAGDSLLPTLMTLCGICLLRAVWVLLIAPGYHDLRMVLICYPITWSVTSILFVIYYFKGRWLERCIRKAGAR